MILVFVRCGASICLHEPSAFVGVTLFSVQIHVALQMFKVRHEYVVSVTAFDFCRSPFFLLRVVIA